MFRYGSIQAIHLCEMCRDMGKVAQTLHSEVLAETLNILACTTSVVYMGNDYVTARSRVRVPLELGLQIPRYKL